MCGCVGVGHACACSRARARVGVGVGVGVMCACACALMRFPVHFLKWPPCCPDLQETYPVPDFGPVHLGTSIPCRSEKDRRGKDGIRKRLGIRPARKQNTRSTKGTKCNEQ